MRVIEREKRIVKWMIGLYCRKRHGYMVICDDCRELLDYAHVRLDRCPFGENKSSCRDCRVHCYSPEMRVRITEVMRFSGPRMILYAPMEVFRHLLRT